MELKVFHDICLSPTISCEYNLWIHEMELKVYVSCGVCGGVCVLWIHEMELKVYPSFINVLNSSS